MSSLAIIAITALAAADPPTAASQPVEVSPLVVSRSRKHGEPVVIGDDHDWMHRPSDKDILSVWPIGAYQSRVDGQVTLDCRVDIHGLAEECAVASETPAGKGFGKAALLLRPSFKLTPMAGPNGPVEAMRAITIVFKASDNDDLQFDMPSGGMGADISKRGIRMNGTPPEMREVMMLDRPVWAAAATFEDVAAAYPAKARGVEGFAVAHCQVDRAGGLWACEQRKEDPKDKGFGPAALALAHKFRVELPAKPPRRDAALWVDVPIRFTTPDKALERTVGNPTWLAGFDPEKAVKLFPPEAVAKGLKTGRGMAHCLVAADGRLQGCTPGPAEPEGLGFSEAAVALASGMRMNPWSDDGRPVQGVAVNLPIRFNLRATKPTGG